MNELNETSKVKPAGKKKKKNNASFMIWMLVVAFLVFFAVNLVNRKKPSVAWYEDYAQARALAQTQNRPLLLVFYKNPGGNSYTRDLFNETFTSEATIEFIETNFIPVRINVIEKKQLGEQFEYGYEPTTLVVDPKDESVLKKRVGYDPPPLFREEIQEGLDAWKQGNS